MSNNNCWICPLFLYILFNSDILVLCESELCLSKDGIDVHVARSKALTVKPRIPFDYGYELDPNQNETELDDYDPTHIENTLLRAGTLQFTYGDNDPNGPSAWEDIDVADAQQCEFNCCGFEHSSPVNIESRMVTLNKGIKKEFAVSVEKKSLEFIFNDNLKDEEWTFGHPIDTWHGVEVRSKESKPGLFQIRDEYDSHLEDGIKISTAYDFSFAQISYCDFSKFGQPRSGHQFDGKKFPFEISMMFFAESLGDNVCLKKSLRDSNRNKFVMVSILADISEHDNHRLEPIIRAASKFKGADNFEINENEGVGKYKVPIQRPFSPTWLIPNASSYYYYNRGSYSVPPCFVIPRVYVLKDTITISKRQLKVLTNIPSKREPSGRLSCTFGVIQDKIDASDVHNNVYPIELIGTDDRPLATRSSSSKIFIYLSLLLIHLGILII